MRWAWLGVLGLSACSQADSLGSYRIPMPDGSNSVALVTVFAREDEGSLILFNTSQNKELDRGKGDFALLDPTTPFQFNVPASAPLQLVVADGVLQDVAVRSYQRVPLTAIDPGATELRRLTLTAGADTLQLVETGGTVFSEQAATQPPITETPGPLFVFNSIAGTGLSLPEGFKDVMNWKDAFSSLVPPDPAMAIACAAPFVSTSRPESDTEIEVPAGRFRTTPVAEVIDTCQKINPPELLVYRVNRWFASGVGPVRLTYTDSDSRVHEYRLKSYHLASQSSDLWPLAEGNSWTYEVTDGYGAVVNPSVTVQVSKSLVVTQH